MKGQLEDAVKALDFDHVIIVRPGLIVGERASRDSRAAEFVLRKLAGVAGSISPHLKDPWAQDAEVIAKAAIRAGLDCVEGKEKEKFRILGQAGEFDNIRAEGETYADCLPQTLLGSGGRNGRISGVGVLTAIRAFETKLKKLGYPQIEF